MDGRPPFKTWSFIKTDSLKGSIKETVIITDRGSGVIPEKISMPEIPRTKETFDFCICYRGSRKFHPGIAYVSREMEESLGPYIGSCKTASLGLWR